MPVVALPLDPYAWDERKRDALAICVFEDERPLRGAAGLADWRLNGRLSRLLKAKRIQGTAGETLMLPTNGRLGPTRLFWFGLGPSKGYSEARLRADLQWLGDVLLAAGIASCALQLPGRALGQIGARRAVEMALDTASLRRLDVALIDDAIAHKDVADVLRHAE